ncbi:MAG: endonuclease [Bacteroidota bacterium]
MWKNIFVVSLFFALATCASVTQKQDNIKTGDEGGENITYEPYYKGVEGLEGEDLAAVLHEKIRGHKTFSYRQCYDIILRLDRDPENPNNVEGIYSDFSMDADEKYADSDGWNREHVWAKSYGDFGNAPGPGTDLHHLRASDVSTNSARNNRAFDEAEDAYFDLDGNYRGETGCFTSNEKWVWEPRKDRKGDIARMMFYMAVRYEGTNGEPDLILVDEIPDRSSKAPYHGKLSTLLKWNEEDPIDDKERKRNEMIFEKYQGNRNPFIDHPEFARKIWGYDF